MLGGLPRAGVVVIDDDVDAGKVRFTGSGQNHGDTLRCFSDRGRLRGGTHHHQSVNPLLQQRLHGTAAHPVIGVGVGQNRRNSGRVQGRSESLQ